MSARRRVRMVAAVGPTRDESRALLTALLVGGWHPLPIVAEDAEYALSVITTLESDAVLVRISLGECGLALILRLRAHVPTIPVVAITALETADVRVSGLTAGACHVVVLPRDRDRVVDVLNAAVRGAATEGRG